MESCLPHGRQGLREDSIVYQSMYLIMLIIAHPNFGRIEGATGKQRWSVHHIMYYLSTQI